MRLLAPSAILAGALLGAPPHALPAAPSGKAPEVRPRELGLVAPVSGDLFGFSRAEGIPSLPPSGELVVKKLRVADCRLVKGFCHSPVDGRPDSWGYNGVVNEYDDSQGGEGHHWQNLGYECIKEPAIHVTLADGDGFNHLMLRGGFVGSLWRDVDTDDGQGRGTRLREIGEAEICGPTANSTGKLRTGHHLFQRLEFPKEVRASRVSFFRKDGLLGDAQFCRVHAAAVPEESAAAREFRPGEPMADLASLGPDFLRFPCKTPAWQHLSNFERRFRRAEDRAAFALVPGTASGRDLALGPSQAVHFFTPPLPANLPVGALRVALDLRGVPPGNLVNVTVQDPLNGNQELLRMDVRMPAAGPVRCLLDFADVLVPEGGRFWVTLASQHGGALGGGSRFSLVAAPEDAARAEHLAWRRFLLKGYFSVLSEARPWNTQRAKPERVWTSGSIAALDDAPWVIHRLRPQLFDLYRLVEHLNTLEPGDPVIAKQYYAWLMRAKEPPLDPALVPAREAPPGVPAWAALMDRAVSSSVAIPDWWLAHRLSSSGEFGGGIGDDSDMTPWWLPLILADSTGFGPKGRAATRRIAELALERNLVEGVNRRTTDPLHAYEEGQNVLCHLSSLEYGNPQLVEWLMTSSRTAEGWLHRDAGGRLRFRVAEFGYDTAQHPPAVPAADPPGLAGLLLHSHLMLAWYNRNPEALKVLLDYADPASGNDLTGDGPSGLRFGAYLFSGNPKYLGLTPDGKCPDGRPWAYPHAEFLVHGAEARQQPWWKNFLLLAARQVYQGDWAWAAGQDRETLCKSLKHAMWGTPLSEGGGTERFRYVWTEAEMFTDRVFLPVDVIGQAMLGGYAHRKRLYPAYAVSYEGLGGDFAALVLDQGRDRLKLAMVNLRPEPREGAFRVWQLEHGRYRLRFGPDANDDGLLDRAERAESLELARMDAVPVTLPPRRVMLCELSQEEKLDDVLLRPDLALSAEDVHRDGGILKVTVHNLGASRAPESELALLDREGKELARKPFPALDAPLDRRPRTAVVEFPALPGAASVCLDPARRVPEITELNNRASVPPPARSP
jgi:hypothetical protein